MWRWHFLLFKSKEDKDQAPARKPPCAAPVSPTTNAHTLTHTHTSQSCAFWERLLRWRRERDAKPKPYREQIHQGEREFPPPSQRQQHTMPFFSLSLSPLSPLSCAIALPFSLAVAYFSSLSLICSRSCLRRGQGDGLERGCECLARIVRRASFSDLIFVEAMSSFDFSSLPSLPSLHHQNDFLIFKKDNMKNIHYIYTSFHKMLTMMES